MLPFEYVELLCGHVSEYKHMQTLQMCVLFFRSCRH